MISCKGVPSPTLPLPLPVLKRHVTNVITTSLKKWFSIKTRLDGRWRRVTAVVCRNTMNTSVRLSACIDLPQRSIECRLWFPSVVYHGAERCLASCGAASVSECAPHTFVDVERVMRGALCVVHLYNCSCGWSFFLCQFQSASVEVFPSCSRLRYCVRVS